MRYFGILMTGVATALAVVLAFVLQQPSISTLEIDRDRSALAAEIKESQSESDKYSGGAIKAFVDLRVAILRSTASMLDQNPNESRDMA